MPKNSPPQPHVVATHPIPPKIAKQWLSAKAKLNAAMAKLPPKAQEYTTAADEATH